MEIVVIDGSVSCLVEAGNLLGESPVWDDRTRVLRWVDVIGRQVHRYRPSTGEHFIRELDGFPTAMALRETRGAIVAMADAIYVYDNIDEGEPELLCVPDGMEKNTRLNDGKCDPQGRFWVGSMQRNFDESGCAIALTKDLGTLFLVKPDGRSTSVLPTEYGIANTLAWSGDAPVFYFADSMKNTLYSFDYDAVSGDISNRRIFNNDFDRGVPDGSAIDSEGFLWNARWGGRCVVRFSPEGSVDRIIDVPVRNPTSCAFGGAAMSTLFVTSARDGLSPDHLDNVPIEGAVLAVETGVPGPITDRFSG